MVLCRTTVSPDFLRSLHEAAGEEGLAAAGGIAEKVLVTAGETRQRRSGATVLPWSAVPTGPWT